MRDKGDSKSSFVKFLMNMKNVELRTNFNALMNSFNEMLVLRSIPSILHAYNQIN